MFLDSLKSKIDCRAGILSYILHNEDFFLQVHDIYQGDYSKDPDKIKYYPFHEKSGVVRSLIAYTASGHYYVKCSSNDIIQVKKFLYQQRHSIFSVYCETELYRFIFDDFSNQIKKTNDFYYMKLNDKDFVYKEYLYDKYSCRLCNKNDFESLCDLQKGYHLEEVYSGDRYYPYRVEMEAFKQSLSNSINFAVFDKNLGKGVSKALVNAKSINNHQLGGIYTIPDKRNIGLGGYCLNEMLLYLLKRKPSVCLFVNIQNQPAISLYKKLGFNNIFNLSIIYME